jgi:TRAP transporter 4TM/12TM fusion protein
VSEERIVPAAEEFRSTASAAQQFWTNVFQALLVGVVVLWVMDIPRLWFGMSFYTEQMLTVCIGLTLALAFIVETDRTFSPIHSGAAVATAVLFAYTIYRYEVVAANPLPFVAGFAVLLAWTFLGARRRFASYFDWVAVVASLIICGYIAIRYEPLTYEIAMLPVEGIVGSAILTFLVLDGSRRTSGWGFVGIILAMAVYIFISPHLPGDFATRNVSPERLIVYLGLDTNGIIGAIVGVAVLVVIPFTIMGQVLARTGGADFFADLAASAMGRFRGGSAKIAVVGSGLFGMISGSAVSNVLAVGIVTIPMMIRSGFTPRKAAAIESVGSTGGQLMPPVMGAAAFIMAEFLQVSYGAVCVAAAIPAFLYYACLFIHVDLEAAKEKIGAAQVEGAPTLGDVFRSGWHFLLPIAFLVFSLLYPEYTRLTPEKTAIVCTAIIVLCTSIFGYRGRKPTVRETVQAVIDTGRFSLDIILIGAAAGIMVGIMSISGLAFGMTLQLISLSGDNVFVLLLIIAVLAFVLGIGLPTVSVYILTATLLAPALVKLGVTPMAAHMFVMYNGMLSMITPPVAFAAYAAANIARTDGWTTGWVACLVGWSTFILPFLFVLTPSLLMDGPAVEIVWNLLRVLFGLYVGTAGILGFSLMPLPKPARWLYGALAAAIVLPPAAFGAALYINCAAVAVAIACLAFERARRGAVVRSQAPASDPRPV